LTGITSFTTSPLRWASIAGMLVSFAGFIYMLVIIFKTLIYGVDVSGYASMMVVILFLRWNTACIFGAYRRIFRKSFL